MRVARAIGLGAVLAFLFRPEVPRYRAERRLGAASAAFEYVIDRPTEVQGAPAILDRITDAALAAASDLPGDTRGWTLAGSCQLVNGNADRALEKRFAAEASFLRAVWISPALLRAVPKEFAGSIEAELHRMEKELAAGRLAAPPARAD